MLPSRRHPLPRHVLRAAVTSAVWHQTGTLTYFPTSRYCTLSSRRTKMTLVKDAASQKNQEGEKNKIKILDFKSPTRSLAGGEAIFRTLESKNENCTPYIQRTEWETRVLWLLYASETEERGGWSEVWGGGVLERSRRGELPDAVRRCLRTASPLLRLTGLPPPILSLPPSFTRSPPSCDRRDGLPPFLLLLLLLMLPTVPLSGQPDWPRRGCVSRRRHRGEQQILIYLMAPVFSSRTI